MFFSASLLMLALLVISPAKADNFDADCIQSWTKTQKRVEGTLSDLSTCQQSTIGFSDANDILLGGSGSAEIMGLDSGSDGDGCTGGNSCMKQCQALCCITKSCIYATVKKETKTVDYGVYKEEEKRYYCRMYKSGSIKDSDTQSTCYPPSSNPTLNCSNIAYEAYKWDSNTYNYFVSLQSNNTCTVSRRRRALLGGKGGNGGAGGDGGFGGVSSGYNSVTLTSKDQINKSIRKAFKPFKTLKKNLKKATSGPTMCAELTELVKSASSTIESSC